MARPVGGRGAPIDGPSVMKRLRDGGGWPLEKEGQPTAGVVGGKLVHRLMGNKLGNPVQDPELVTIDSPLLKRPTRSGVAGGWQRTQSRASVPQRPKLCAPFGDRFL
jgi:hypothetical protein